MDGSCSPDLGLPFPELLDRSLRLLLPYERICELLIEIRVFPTLSPLCGGDSANKFCVNPLTQME
jgi:hypothetical protein